VVKKAVPSRPPSDRRPKNLLLRALPAADFERLRPHLTTIPTPTRHLFYKSGAVIDSVYFPNGSVASVTAVLADGTMVETATIGVEGMVGIEAYLGTNAISPGETLVQVAGTDAERMTVSAFRAELTRRGALFDLIGRYAQATIAQMMQSAACNARHHVQERCPRWLLMTHDRVGGDEFELSHEFLAVKLGVRRQSVTVVAGTLQAAGLISYKHGHIKILDRKGLETASCECYAVVRRRFDDLLTWQRPVSD
jgi:CRP-like cAMP-binding protein